MRCFSARICGISPRATYLWTTAEAPIWGWSISTDWDTGRSCTSVAGTPLPISSGRRAICGPAGNSGWNPRLHHSDFARSSIENGYQLVKELFAKPIDYTAIFASTDSNALGILKAADELHIRIPGDLSLIGFDNIPSTALPRIDLTTIEQPKKEMAVQAVDMLLDKIEKGTQGYVHQILMPSLVQRGTCRSLT